MKLLTPILALTTLLAFVAAPPVHAQADHSAIKTKIKQMEDAWAKSQLDKDHGAAAVKEMLAADFAGVNSKGEMQNKKALVAKMKGETDTYTSSVNDHMDVHVYAANLATVCGRSTEAGKDKNGKEFRRSYGWTDTWMERNGKWECIASCGMLLGE